MSRLYNYDENLIRENSRKRPIRKQLCFTKEEIETINLRMEQLGISNFSLYMRALSLYGNITREEINNIKDSII